MRERYKSTAECGGWEHLSGLDASVGLPFRPGQRRDEGADARAAAGAPHHAGQLDPSKRVGRLNENLGKSDQEIWGMIA